MMSKYKDLEIHIPQEELDDEVCIRHVPLSQVRTLSSMKNLHDLKKAENQEMPGNLVMNLKIKLMNMRKLEKEKKDLIKQYQSLKKGAIWAIMEKEDMIQSLKQKCDNYQLYGGDQQLQELEAELQKHLNHILELQQEREQLREKIQNQRALYMEDIQNKSHMISTLWRELQFVQQQLQKIETKEATVQLKLRITEQQNQKLVRSLSETKQNYFMLKSSYCQRGVQKQTKQIQAVLSESSNERESEGQISQNQQIQEHEAEDFNRLIIKNKSLLSPTSSASTKPNRFDRLFKAKQKDIEPQSFFNQKLMEQRARHRHQIDKLNQFYSEQLQALREQVQKTYHKFQHQNDQYNSQKVRQLPLRVTQLNGQCDSDEQFIQRNLNVEFQQQIQPINLRKVIKNCDSAQNLKIDINELQIEPQCNYSPNYSPLQSDRTNKSYASLNQSQNQNGVSQIEDKSSQQCSQETWTKKVCFVIGVITGGSLVALVSKIIYANH